MITVRDALHSILNNPEEIRLFKEEFNRVKENQEKAQLAFFNSPLCHRLAFDLVSKNMQLDTEHFSYFGSKVKEQMGWNDISDDTIQLFFETMDSSHLPEDEGITMQTQLEPEDYEEALEQDERHHFRLGLHTFTLYGQGAITMIRPYKKI